MTWALAWKFLRSWWGGVAIGVLGLLTVQILWSARLTSAPGPTPYTAEPTKRAAEADKVTETLPVQTLKPVAKVRERIAREYRQPGIVTPDRQGDPKIRAASEDSRRVGDSSLADNWAKEIVSEVKFEPAPDGGTALTTIDRATGLPETTVLPKKGLSLRNRWLLGGAYGRIETHDPAEPWAEVWRARAAWTPACRRAACASLEAGVLGGWKEPTAYGLVEISVGNR